jgi:cohesin loading factor subunit SCC2
MTEIETNILSRLLKMLERSVKAGEDLDPFATASYHGIIIQSNGREGTASPRKKKASGKKAERRSKSQTPRDDGEDAIMGDKNEEIDRGRRDHEMLEADYEHLTKTLEVARDSVLSADCCIALLASDRLPKQVRQLSADIYAMLIADVAIR